MNNWPEFDKHPMYIKQGGIGSVTISESQYNQARDAIAWRKTVTEIYPNIAAYIDELIAQPQPTGEL